MALIEVEEKELDNIRKDGFLNWQRLQNKIQCFASQYALNNTFEDMNEVQKKGVFAVTLSCHENSWSPEHTHYYYFNVAIIKREDMQECRRHDYSMSDFYYYSHLFFEIPIVRTFNDTQVAKWQDYCLRTLSKQLVANKKKAKQWLKIKKANEDFED